MLKTLLKVFLFSFCFFLYQDLQAQTESEPNNTPATADALALNGKISGAITASDIDWYKVATNGDGALTLTLAVSNSLFAHYELYDTLGAIQLHEANTAGTDSYTYDGLAKGTYYIKVYAYYDGQTPAYTLSNSLTAPVYANDAEPDSTRAQALSLALNGSASGHIGYYYNNHRDSLDWYKFTTTGDGLVKIKIKSANAYYVSCRLYDNDGTTQLNYVEAANATSEVSTDGLAAGTYYLKINTYYNNQFVPYTVSDSLFKPTQPNDAEPDSTKALALSLPLNGSATGHIGYFYNNHRDSADWYKFVTTGDGLIKLKITSSNANFVSARLFDNDGTTQLAYVEAANATQSISTDGLAAGTYYVKINSYYNNQFAPYVVADSLFAPAQANDKEPNDSKATAVTIGVNSKITGHSGYYYNNHRDSADWYKVTIPQDGLVKLIITSANGNFVSGRLYDNDGTTQLSYVEAVNATNAISADGLAAGTYYIKVNPYYNNQFVPYVLTDSLLTYTYASDTLFEPNKYAAQAKTIPANTVTTGHTNFYYNNMRDSVDWYRINYTGSGNLALSVDLEPNKIDNGDKYIWVQVYKDTTATPIYSDNFIASRIIDLTSLTQGYYYIKTYTYYNNQFQAYAITPTFTQVAIAKIAVSKSGSGTTCGSDSIVYNLSGSHAPYMIKLYKNGVLYDSAISIASTITFKGLDAGSYYATAYGDGATGTAFGTSATVTLLPPVPTVLTTTNIGLHNATLHWSPLSCVNYYRVQYRKVASSTWTTVTVSKNSLPLLGLDSATTYSWHVASIDSIPGKGFTSAYSDSAIFRTLGVLPVSFVSFSATLRNDKGLLNWVTAEEINAKGFNIEKSTDGVIFNNIGFVAAISSGAKSAYNFTDNNLINGSNYYRLQEVDVDGAYQYSHIAKIDYSKFAWMITGNPSSKPILQLMLDKPSTVTIQVLSLNGSVVKSIQKGNLSVGNYTIPLQLNNVSAGVYVVKMMIGNQSYTTKVMKD